MTMRRFLILLAASLLVIAGALYLSSQRHLDRDPRGVAFLSGLDAQLDSITAIRLRKGGATPVVSLHRSAPGQWVISERDNYPADLDKIRRLLLSLSEAKIVEEKTAKPASYAVLGVEDPQNAGAGGIEVTLVTPGKNIGVIVGHAGGSGSYLRRTGEAGTFAVEPAVTVDIAIRDWMDTKLLDIPLEKIQGIRMKLADGTRYSIARSAAPVAKAVAATAPPAAFRLDAVPLGREANDPSLISPSPTTFSGVPADDVATAASIDFSKPASAEVELFDGSLYTMNGSVIADKHWITVHASKDDALNARAAGRAFEIAGYRYEALFRPLEQLLKPKPVKPAASRP